MEREGGCACGAMRYRLTAAPLIVHACHCRDCQRLTGDAFALNTWIERRFVDDLLSLGAAPDSSGRSWPRHTNNQGHPNKDIPRMTMAMALGTAPRSVDSRPEWVSSFLTVGFVIIPHPCIDGPHAVAQIKLFF
jgi:hypothetical protein